MRYLIALTMSMLLTGIASAQDAAPADAPDAPTAPATPSAAADSSSPDANGDAQPTADEAQPADDEAQPAADDTVKLTATVISAEGVAQQRSVVDDTGKWLALAAGDELSEMTVIRTGLGAMVVLQMADRGEITIHSATKIGIASFREDADEKVTTRMGIKYGSIHARVDSSKGANDFEIHTPVATLSIRGTDGYLGFSYRGLGLNGTEGTWNNSTPNGDTQVGAGQTSDENGTPSGDLDDASRHTQTGDTFGGLSDEENANRDNTGGRGGFSFTGGGGNTGGPPLFGGSGMTSSSDSSNGHSNNGSGGNGNGGQGGGEQGGGEEGGGEEGGGEQGGGKEEGQRGE